MKFPKSKPEKNSWTWAYPENREEGQEMLEEVISLLEYNGFEVLQTNSRVYRGDEIVEKLVEKEGKFYRIRANYGSEEYPNRASNIRMYELTEETPSPKVGPTRGE